MGNEIDVIATGSATDASAVSGGFEQRLASKPQSVLDISSGADMADAANSAQHDLAQKKAKLANHAYEEMGADSESTPEEQRKSTDRNRSAFSKALGASGDKIINGAMMFAGFSILLAASMFGVSSILGAVAGEAFITSGIGKLLATVTAAATTGAAWLGGNEFLKVYKAEREIEDSRLNRTIEAAKERLHIKGKEREADVLTEKEIGELGIVAGSLSSNIGTTGFLVAVPDAYLDQAPQTANQTVARILAEGPQSRTSAVVQASSATDRLAQEATLEGDGRLSV
jgi:hypothetical protein